MQIKSDEGTLMAESVVLMIGNRFFSGKSKTGRATTAWSLSGAKLFAGWITDEIKQSENFLIKKGYNPKKCKIELVSGSYCKAGRN